MTGTRQSDFGENVSFFSPRSEVALPSLFPTAGPVFVYTFSPHEYSSLTVALRPPKKEDFCKRLKVNTYALHMSVFVKVVRIDRYQY